MTTVSMKSITVVIPTYNERDNLPRLVRGIAALRIPGLNIFIVDDNSPDGTGTAATELAKQYPIRVLSRPRKQGLGTAYVAGFRAALAEQPDAIVQMDADLSHDPTAIPALLKQLERCDLVLGSRYVAGGRIENWNAFRRFISRCGNRYARTVLGLPFRDVTGGFKCFRREALERLDFSRVSSIGYNFQIETTYRLHRLGLKICEIPITFTERTVGKSKFNFLIVLESFWKVLFLALKK